jgi:hypothetical protein
MKLKNTNFETQNDETQTQNDETQTQNVENETQTSETKLKHRKMKHKNTNFIIAKPKTCKICAQQQTQGLSLLFPGQQPAKHLCFASM